MRKDLRPIDPDSSHAIEEASKAASKAIESAMRTGRYYLPRDLVGIVGDQVAQIRARRWAELHAETEKILLSSHRRVSVMSITNLGVYAAAVLVAALLCNPVEAQQQPQTVTLSSLISQGFEIKAASNTGGSAAQVFLQKGKDVFACVVLLPLETGTGHRESRCSPVD